MSANRQATDQNAAPADGTEEGPTEEEDGQGVIVTAQPPRSEDDAESDSADAAEPPTDRQGGHADQGPLPTSAPPDERTSER